MFLLQATQSSPFMAFLFPLLILVVFYFFLLRPQIKKQKDQQKMIDSLKEGQEVVTTAGIIGKVVRIDGNIVRLLVDEKTYIRVLKQTISGEYKTGA
ncbi:MAG: preprotein translocase subunit YajC [Saprospiraceae bacterium]|nr:preprotein translocase subunit YajC [Saprospiraceae bacterium]